MNYISEELRKRISGNMGIQTVKTGKYVLEPVGDWKIRIEQQGWGTAVYDLTEISAELKRVQKEFREGNLDVIDANDRREALLAAQEALTGR
jgi:hypothetical protein